MQFGWSCAPYYLLEAKPSLVGQVIEFALSLKICDIVLACLMNLGSRRSQSPPIIPLSELVSRWD